jgi:hypothetical protein
MINWLPNRKDVIKDCKVNDITFQKLIEHYQASGFLYPEKEKYIKPHLELIESNWEKALSAKGDDQSILWVNTFDVQVNNQQKMGSVSLWRTTTNGWNAQHLSSTGYPSGVFAIMFRMQMDSMVKQYHSGQNWFQPTNMYASRIFGNIVQTLGKEHSIVHRFNYFEIKPENIQHYQSNLKIIQLNKEHLTDIRTFVSKCRSKIFTNAEELYSTDIELDQLNSIYQKVGLNRKRFIWGAYYKNQLVAAVLVYRGPFGMNFSYLENRCELLLEKELNYDMKVEACHALLNKAQDVYFESNCLGEYPLKFIPVLSFDHVGWILKKEFNAKLIRKYNQSIWLREGFPQWLDHLNKSFDLHFKRISHKVYEDRMKDFEQKGCQVNQIPVQKIFNHYQQAKFIYPEKMKRIAPHMDLIQRNWNKAYQWFQTSRDKREKKYLYDLLCTISIQKPEKNRIATVTTWRSSLKGLMAEHLVSNCKNPSVVRQIQLFTQAKAICEDYGSIQNWFRPDNPYAKLHFKTITHSLSKASYFIDTFHYIKVIPKGDINTDEIQIKNYKEIDKQLFVDFIQKERGSVYIQGEELDGDDVLLEQLNKSYLRAGLLRNRTIYIACFEEKTIGAAIAYRGPLGFNFSFIENRCDLIVDKRLDNDLRTPVCRELMKKVEKVYLDQHYPLDYIPTTTDKACADILIQDGAERITLYTQTIWLNSGFEKWYKHMYDLYDNKM